MDLQTIKRVGTRAAYRAGRILNEQFGNSIRVTKKGAIDLVTEADVAAEKAIVDTIREFFPEHAILAEESGAIEGKGPHRWIIDPLDGTTNFAHRLPVFAVSIAYEHENQLLMGIVFNPMNGELFSAVSGTGAQLNGEAIRVSAAPAVGESLLVTGFPYTLRSAALTSTMTQFTHCLKSAQGIRRLGSAALDLCYVGCGRFDGFWEEGLKPWDTAAGYLIATEAGARVTDYADQPFRIDSKNILATNALIHREMVDLLNTEDMK